MAMTCEVPPLVQDVRTISHGLLKAARELDEIKRRLEQVERELARLLERMEQR